MTGHARHRQFSKSERALELFEKGLSSAAIAERLGTTARSVSALILNAKQRREREIERAGRLADILGANV
jgi:DNA-binding CsgD family transcriptional regulator